MFDYRNKKQRNIPVPPVIVLTRKSSNGLVQASKFLMPARIDIQSDALSNITNATIFQFICSEKIEKNKKCINQKANRETTRTICIQSINSHEELKSESVKHLLSSETNQNRKKLIATTLKIDRPYTGVTVFI